MSRFFYSIFFYLAVPFVLLRLMWRSRKEPGYRADIMQRFGFFTSPNAGNVIWIHAVSAGETIAVVPLVQRLTDQGYSCLVTNMTPTGRDRVRSLLGGRVENSYAPYDLPGAVSRFLDNNRPRLQIIVDTELWPNTLAACRHRAIPVLLINGRMSERSARGYQKISGLSRPMFSGLSVLGVQTEQHRQRFIHLGARDDRVHVCGSIKFDTVESSDIADKISRARVLTKNRPVLLGASTHDGEESAVIQAYLAAREQRKDLLLILAPRHTHRVSKVVKYCDSAGISFGLFSECEDRPLERDALIVDGMGELAALFHVADVALVGGSMIPVGGHNLLEAVRAECAVVMGTHLDNINDIANQFEEAGGMVIVADEKAFIRETVDLFSDEDKRRATVAAASQVLESNRGALDRVEALIIQQLEQTDRS